MNEYTFIYINYIYMYYTYIYIIHTYVYTYTHAHMHIGNTLWGRKWESEKPTCFLVLFLFFNRHYFCTFLNLGALKSNDILCQWSSSWHPFWRRRLGVCAVIYNKYSEFRRQFFPTTPAAPPIFPCLPFWLLF